MGDIQQTPSSSTSPTGDDVTLVHDQLAAIRSPEAAARAPQYVRVVDALIEVLSLGTLLVVPYAVDLNAAQPFGLIQALGLRSLVCVIALLSAFRVLLPAPPTRHVAPPSFISIGTLLLAVAAIAMSTIASPVPNAAFWGGHIFNEGAVTWLCLILFGGLLAVRTTTSARLDRLILVLIWGTVPLLRFALAQTLKGDPIPWVPGSFQSIPYPSDSAVLSGLWAAMIAPLTFYRTVISRAFETRLLYGVLCVIQITVVVLTHTVSAITVLIGGIVALALLTRSLRQSSGRFALVLGLTPLAAAVLAIALSGVAASRSTPPLHSLAASVGRGDSWAARTALASGAWTAVGQHPLVGWGPDIEADVLNNLANGSASNALQGATRTNSTYLDILIQGGVLGELALVLIVIVAMTRLMAAARAATAATPDERLRAAALASMLLAMSAALWFCSPTVGLWIVLIGMLAAAHGAARMFTLSTSPTSPLSDAEALAAGSSRAVAGLLLLAGTLLVLWLPVGPLGFFWQGWNYAQADIYSVQAQANDNVGQVSAATTQWTKVLSTWSHDAFYWAARANTETEQAVGLSGTSANLLFAQAVADDEQAYQMNRLNLDTALKLAGAQTEWAINLHPTSAAALPHVTAARSLYNDAIGLSPNTPAVTQAAAFFEQSVGNYAASHIDLKRALTIAEAHAPDQVSTIANALSQMADAAASANQPSKDVLAYRRTALAAYLTAIAHDGLNAASVAPQIVTLAFNVQDLPTTIRFTQLLVATPQASASQQVMSALGMGFAASMQAKNYHLALSVLQQAHALAPTDPTISALITEVTKLLAQHPPKK